MWSICFREYDSSGSLTELISVRSKTVKCKWKQIQSFLKSCSSERVREVQFCRNGKQQPSLISNGESIQFSKPIVAMLPLFDYARRLEVEV